MKVWLVKLYEVLPKSVSYLGDEEWTNQREAKRFASKAEARAAANEHDNAVVVRLRSKDRPKKPDIVYIQRDLEAIKHTLDEILRPYKADVKNLRAENASLRGSIASKEDSVERLMRLIAKRWPEALDDVLSAMVDPNRRGWKKFRSNWLHRLGLEET